jgi:hypothetical protein
MFQILTSTHSRDTIATGHTGLVGTQARVAPEIEHLRS